MLTKAHEQPLDPDACSRELIHLPSAIQPHGFLLAVTEPELRVTQASSNAQLRDSLGQFKHAGVVGHHLSEIIGGKACERLVGQLDRLTGGRVVRVSTVSLPGAGGGEGATTHGEFDVLVHRRDGVVIVEMERSEREPTGLDEFPSHVIELVSGLHGKSAPEQVCAVAAREMRRLSGFDRVLIYRFDANGHGQVLAEDRNDRLPSYLGLWFPASDIPAQARELYRLSRSRIIPDAGYRPVPIEPRDNPATGRPLDLTFSTLRSVSPVHVEYMRNMGTAASMSFSIIRDGALWGLISCHHAAPKFAPYAVRRACEVVAEVLALQLTASERQVAMEGLVRLRQYVSRLLKSMAEADDFVEGLAGDADDLLAVAGASGAALVSGDVCRLIGKTPDEAQVKQIVAWLSPRRHGSGNGNGNGKSVASALAEPIVRIDNLPARFPPAEHFRSVCSGLLATSISATSRSYIMWFRPEMVETVVWAGDPRKSADAGAGPGAPDRLNPRKSFEAWTEIVRGTASPWSDAEVAAVTELQADAVGIVLRKAEELAALSAELQRSNKELEAFSYSVSHDLRAPFRHIVGYAELLRDRESAGLSDRGRRYAGIVIDAARDAGKLIDNLLAFSHMGRATIAPMPVDLNQMVKEVRAEVMAAEGAGREVQWHVGELPAVVADMSMLRLALRNLLSNAVKYTRDRGPDARVDIRARRTDDEVIFEITDNGVGFDMRYSDKLFGVFQRLHRMEEFEGTGIGLANVRRIVERHGGRVWAEGKVDHGATFGFALPNGLY